MYRWYGALLAPLILASLNGSSLDKKTINRFYFINVASKVLLGLLSKVEISRQLLDIRIRISTRLEEIQIRQSLT